MMRRLVGHAYTHSNGFDKIVLDSLSEFGVKLRLHMWWRGGSASESTIHNHPWDFASYVSLGTMEMRRYVVASGPGEGFMKAVYPTKATPEREEALVQGVTHVRRVGEHRYVAGRLYVLRHFELHSVAVVGDRLMTLVLQGPHLASSTDVYMQIGGCFPSPVAVDYFSAEEIGVRLRAAADWLTK
jgi:hypothetical protein